MTVVTLDVIPAPRHPGLVPGAHTVLHQGSVRLALSPEAVLVLQLALTVSALEHALSDAVRETDPGGHVAGEVVDALILVGSEGHGQSCADLGALRRGVFMGDRAAQSVVAAAGARLELGICRQMRLREALDELPGSCR